MSRLERFASKLNQIKGMSHCYTNLFSPKNSLGANLCTDMGFPLDCTVCVFNASEVTQRWFNQLFGEEHAPKLKIN